MASFARKDYVRLYEIGCDIHRTTRNKRLKEHAATMVDMAEVALGQLHRPQGMRASATTQMMETRDGKG